MLSSSLSRQILPHRLAPRWNSGDTIFLGKIIVLDKLPPPESGAFLSSYAVRFTVEETFRGSAPPSGEVVVYTGSRLHTGICSQTAPAVMAGGVLRELRAVRDHQQPDLA